ncbi:hypothetical protein [Escherichia phage vB_EcoS_IME542]|uniref:Uncharacterized protein n=1 Tax=Escherichia phage vB_EcoS_IME542 TaxID=2507711 RepID=A0A410T629_9CAUD|nr:hypothetical protein HOV01_gp27 [Escherichia phage vB_EcoS_IME542]QAU04399.1 hypothetical protein [Escherichia phage vB_EcoS_IME542]
MSERKEAVSLGEVARYMATQALNSDTKSFAVPVRMIVRQVYGLSKEEISKVYDEDLKPDGKYNLNKLKSSYVSNTVSRMPEIKAANVRSMFSIKDMEFNGEEVRSAVISLVPGAINHGSRSKAGEEREAAIIEKFKKRLLAVTPSVIHLKGEELNGAMFALTAYQELIKETK